MTHKARQLGESGFYHVVTKGDGGQIIFENDRDRTMYLELLESCVGEYSVNLHAYCLMSNHVHLLLEDDCEKHHLSPFMKRLDETYAMYFANASGRVGHVFKGRFWSEPINTDEYLISAIRYIHANPEPAKISRAEDYPWSSYQAYCGAPSIVKTDFALELLGGAQAFKSFSANGGSYAKPFATSKLCRHLSPDELTNIALALLGRETLSTIRQLQPKERVPYIEKLSSAGFNEQEIVRVTGLGRQIVRSALLRK